VICDRKRMKCVQTNEAKPRHRRASPTSPDFDGTTPQPPDACLLPSTADDDEEESLWEEVEKEKERF